MRRSAPRRLFSRHGRAQRTRESGGAQRLILPRKARPPALGAQAARASVPTRTQTTDGTCRPYHGAFIANRLATGSETDAPRERKTQLPTQTTRLSCVTGRGIGVSLVVEARQQAAMCTGSGCERHTAPQTAQGRGRRGWQGRRCPPARRNAPRQRRRAPHSATDDTGTGYKGAGRGVAVHQHVAMRPGSGRAGHTAP